MTHVPGWRLPPVQLRFDPAIERVHAQAYQGLRRFGPFDTANLNLGEGSLLFVFPANEQALARALADGILNGVGSFPGFEEMFRVPVQRGQSLKSLAVAASSDNLPQAANAYRSAITDWMATAPREPELAIVLVPKSERFDVDTPYYEAKATFAALGIPTQMVTIDLLRDRRQFEWSVANIALAAFAKLGGVPWSVAAPGSDNDLVVGIGRADIRRHGSLQQHFGYAVAMVSNGIYRHTYSFTPTSDHSEYEQRLQQAISSALAADVDRPPNRLVIHLASQTGRREVVAAEQALASSGLNLPVAYLRLDDTSLNDLADTGDETFAPPKGIGVQLGRRRALLQTEGLGALGPPSGPLLVTMDRRSTVDPNAFRELVEQTYSLAHANWRGFNAQTKPATLVYGEQLASLVGHLVDVQSWNPELLRSGLRTRPWFL